MYGASSSYLPALAQYPYSDDEVDEYGQKKRPMLRGPAIKPAVQPQIRQTPASLPSPEEMNPPPIIGQGQAPAIAPPDRLSNRIPMDTNREGVPLPSLPGETRGPYDWSQGEQDRYDQMQGWLGKQPGAKATDEVGRAKFEHMVGGLKRDEAGRIQPEYQRNWKTVGMNMLKGFLQGVGSNATNPLAAGIGGLATAGITSAASPKAAREYDFERGQRISMEREQQRQRQIRQGAYEEKKQDLDIKGEEANIEGTRARTDATRAGMKDADLLRRKGEAEIGVLEARREALRTGKPTYRDVEQSDGTIHTIQIFPDGSMMDMGRSGRAAMGERQINSREDIADKNRLSREKTTGATIQSRERMGQAGIKSREGIAAAGRESREKIATQNRGVGGGPLSGMAKKFTVGKDVVEAYVRKKMGEGVKITYEQAEKMLRDKGYTIK